MAHAFAVGDRLQRGKHVAGNSNRQRTPLVGALQFPDPFDKIAGKEFGPIVENKMAILRENLWVNIN